VRPTDPTCPAAPVTNVDPSSAIAPYLLPHLLIHTQSARFEFYSNLTSLISVETVSISGIGRKSLPPVQARAWLADEFRSRTRNQMSVASLRNRRDIHAVVVAAEHQILTEERILYTAMRLNRTPEVRAEKRTTFLPIPPSLPFLDLYTIHCEKKGRREKVQVAYPLK
jgi:hypothetical protein